jgi:hypothetical protein
MPNTAILQSFVKRSKTTAIQVPNQVIPFICVFIIAKTPTYLLVGFVLGYMMILKRTPPPLLLEDNTKERRVIELPPSLTFDNEIHHASVNHYPELRVYENESSSETLTLKEEDEDLSNGSLEFEKLMRFPPCPATLPRLDTQFNFVVDYHQDMKTSDPSEIDWSAIHQKLEYDQQRQQDDQQHKKQVRSNSAQPSLFIIQNQQDMSCLSSLSSSSDDDEEETSSLCSFHVSTATHTTATTLVQVVEKSAPITNNSPVWLVTPLPHDNKTTNNYSAATSAAILFVENEVEENNNNETNLFDDCIEDLFLSPAAPFPSKPSFSSPGQLFKSKFQNAVKKMKKKSSLPIQNKEQDFVMKSKRSSAYSSSSSSGDQHQSDPPDATKKKARSLQIHAYFPSPSTSSSSQSKNSTALPPRPSVSARMHDHFKGRLNKLFKK